MAALAEQSAATQREAALVSAVRLAVKEAAELRQKLSLLATSSLGAATARDGIELQVAGADEQHRSEESQPRNRSLVRPSQLVRLRHRASHDGSGGMGTVEGVGERSELVKSANASPDLTMDAARRIQAAWMRWRWRHQRYSAASRIAAYQRRRSARVAFYSIRIERLEARKIAAAAAAREAAAAAAAAAASAASVAAAAAAMAGAERQAEPPAVPTETTLEQQLGDQLAGGPLAGGRGVRGGRGGRCGRGVQVQAQAQPVVPIVLASAQLDAGAEATDEVQVVAAAVAPTRVQWRRVAPKAAQQHPCPFFARGCCQNGDGCSRSHDVGKKARPLPCEFFAQGRCRFGADCRFSHEL